MLKRKNNTSKTKKLNMLLVFFSVLLISLSCAAQDLTITTYYPAPFGVFNRLLTRTLGVGDTNADGALTSADAPNPAVRPGDVWIAGRLGVGTSNPSARLEINNTMILQSFTGAVPACSAANEGTLYYDDAAKAFRYCSSGSWRGIGGFQISTTIKAEPRASWGYHTGYGGKPTVALRCPNGYVATGLKIYTDNKCNAGSCFAPMTGGSMACSDGRGHETGEIQRLGLMCNKVE